MRRTVIFAGEAGSGVDRTALMFGRTLTDHGYSCFIYRDYASLIRGGHNFSVVTFGSDPVNSHDNKADVIVALGKEAVSRHKKDLLREGVLITTGDYGDDRAVIAPGGSGRHLGNNSSLGMLAKMFGLDPKKAKKVLENEFGGISGTVATAFDAGYDLAEASFPMRRGKASVRMMDGGEAVACAAIHMGVEAAFYYPMTPATGAFSKLGPEYSGKTVKVIRTEDEIAAANAALGASFAGARVMTGSSGGGLALMGEAISLAGMAELPLVVYAAQRMGPSTGVPTYTAQGDIKFILALGPGEFPKFVVVPGDAEEAYEMTARAFYFAEKYRLPAFILSDKHIAESYFSVPKKPITDVPVARSIIKRAAKKDYRSYEMTSEGYSAMAIPGSGAVVRATSYEHDEYGFTTEDPKMITAMNDKRKRKSVALGKEASKYLPIVSRGKGSKVIVLAGSVKGAVIDALPFLNGWRAIQIRHLEPFPKKEFLKAIKGAREVVVIESNSTGLLTDIIREKTGIEVKRNILKYDGRPFTSDEVISAIKEKKKKR